MRSLPLLFAAASLLLSTACSSGGASSSGAPDGGTDGGGGAPLIGGDRPVTVYVPHGYDPSTPTPLVMLLHGYGASGDLEEAYLGLDLYSQQRGFLYVHPDGTTDSTGNEFWNATDACCAFAGKPVDDSAYLSGVITQIETYYNVDPKRVFLIGHSNGAFMSYRMACDHADQIAAIASLAGAMWEDTAECKPSGPVGVVEIHGTADMTISYTGGSIEGHAYPSAMQSVEDWVTFDACNATADTLSPNLDLEASIPGAETKVTKWETGCRPSSGVELWSIQGAGHIPDFTPNFDPDVLDFLYAHAKP
jgi:polyhydroxybutyrate depolymerase